MNYISSLRYKLGYQLAGTAKACLIIPYIAMNHNNEEMIKICRRQGLSPRRSCITASIVKGLPFPADVCPRPVGVKRSRFRHDSEESGNSKQGNSGRGDGDHRHRQAAGQD